MPEAPLLRARGLRVVYPGRRPHVAVDRVDLDVHRGRTVGLVGESGSGKTSLGHALLGIVPADAGTIELDGHDITRRDRARRRALARRMQAVFQDPYGSMNPARTVGDTVGEMLRFNLGLDADAVSQRVEAALADVGLGPDAAHLFPSQFSGGQRQRIAIARAIVGRPDFVVCDEPVSALDLSVQAQVLNVFAGLKESHHLSYLFISHDLSVVRYLSDEIVVMFAGRIVERGPARVVADTPAHPYTRALVAAAPVPDPEAQARRRDERRRLVVNAAAPAGAGGCAFAQRCPFAIEECRTTPPPLVAWGDRAVACHRYDGSPLHG